MFYLHCQCNIPHHTQSSYMLTFHSTHVHLPYPTAHMHTSHTSQLTCIPPHLTAHMHTSHTSQLTYIPTMSQNSLLLHRTQKQLPQPMQARLQHPTQKCLPHPTKAFLPYTETCPKPDTARDQYMISDTADMHHISLCL